MANVNEAESALSRCDLCGSDEVSQVLSSGTEMSMTSDYKLRNGELVKLVCGRCGLVRSGPASRSDELITQYRSDYFLSNENYFYTKEGPVPRAKIFSRWILDAFGLEPWRSAKRILEIGASNGDLLQEFSKVFPEADFQGLELNEAAAEVCRSKDFETHSCELADLGQKDFDLIYSIAVLEHTTSPTEFLEEIHQRLNLNGLLILCQPTQEVYSHDVFFVDHLYHFGAQHIRDYASKCGFRELESIVGHPNVPGFSLHLWRKTGVSNNYHWAASNGESRCKESFNSIMHDINRLNQKLTLLRQNNEKTAVFGVNELFSLLYAYSNLREFPIAYGLDDNPEKADYLRFNFPVIKPEACAELGVENVLLTMNKAHYEYARERLLKIGLKPYEVFH